MKTAIIITFHNYEKEININAFINYCNKVKSIEFCFVNNDSKDNTNSLLKEVKEQCDNVSVVNIKKFKSDMSAVRSGARYMFNQFKLNHLGYVNTNSLNKQNHGLSVVMRAISKHQEAIIEYDKEILKKHNRKKTLFQKLFSVSEYLLKLELELQVESLYCQSEFENDKNESVSYKMKS
ncbi:MAG: hypothetical protein ACJA1H_001382 [Glaciecola sp.]|jgi:hypothetical protein